MYCKTKTTRNVICAGHKAFKKTIVALACTISPSMHCQLLTICELSAPTMGIRHEQESGTPH